MTQPHFYVAFYHRTHSSTQFARAGNDLTTLFHACTTTHTDFFTLAHLKSRREQSGRMERFFFSENIFYSIIHFYNNHAIRCVVLACSTATSGNFARSALPLQYYNKLYYTALFGEHVRMMMIKSKIWQQKNRSKHPSQCCCLVADFFTQPTDNSNLYVHNNIVLE